MDRDEIYHHLRGPVTSIRTPFNRDGSVDYDGLRAFIDSCIGNGSKTMILTAGDSHYLCLSDAEIAEITKVTVEHASGRAMVIYAMRSLTAYWMNWCGMDAPQAAAQRR